MTIKYSALAFLLATIAHKVPKPLDTQLLVITADGFRWDYLDLYPKQTKNIRALAGIGVKPKWMTPQFVTKTFPAHYSMATGLYVESHGIVLNKFYDPVTDSKFAYSSDAKFYSAEPIWHTFEKQTDRNSATYFWPGSEATNFVSSKYKI